MRPLLTILCLLPLLGTAGHRRVRHFNPRDAGAVLALDSRFGFALNDGDAVSTWEDRTANNNDATQTSTARPTYETGEQGGQPVILFDGTNDFFNLTTAFSPATHSAVSVQQRRAAGTTMVSVSNSNAVSGWASIATAQLFDNSIYAGTGFYYGYVANSLTNWNILSETANSSTFTISINGVAQSISTGAGPGAANFENIGYYSASYYNDGKMGSTAIFTTVISDPIRRRLEQAAALSFKIAQ